MSVKIIGAIDCGKTKAESALELSRCRKQYDKEILELYQSLTIRYEWLTKKCIENKIKENCSDKKYTIAEKDGIKVLKIGRPKRGRGKQIVPIEDYFDAIYAAHIFTGHGAIDSMRGYLDNKNLFVPKKALVCFLRLCGPCKAAKFENSEHILTYHGFLELIDMSKIPDGDARFVMHFRALKLNRVYLRALCSSDAVEVAEQLLKLFANIGPPRKLHTPTMSFTKVLIQRLAILCPDCKIICGREMLLEVKSSQIKTNIRDWMTYYKTTEWSKGIHTFSAFPYRKKLQELKEAEKMDEPGPSIPIEPFVPSEPGTSENLMSKKVEHELYCQNNASGDEVLKLLRPTFKTYQSKKSTKASTSQMNVPKRDYSRKNKNTSVITSPSDENKIGAIEKRALCIDTNIKALNGRVSKRSKKFHEIWNSTLDLPQQNKQIVKTMIGINMTDNTNFGMIPKESVDIVDTSLFNEVGQLSYSQENNDARLEISKDFTVPVNNNDNIEELEYKEDIKPVAVGGDFVEESKCFDDISDLYTFENKPIKKEPICSDTLTNSDNVCAADIKQEDQDYLGIIIKIESVAE